VLLHLEKSRLVAVGVANHTASQLFSRTMRAASSAYLCAGAITGIL